MIGGYSWALFAKLAALTRPSVGVCLRRLVLTDQATLGPAMAEHSFAHRTGKPCQTFGGASSLRFEALHAAERREKP